MAGAEARIDSIAFCGTTEVVPLLQNNSRLSFSAASESRALVTKQVSRRVFSQALKWRLVTKQFGDFNEISRLPSLEGSQGFNVRGRGNHRHSLTVCVG